LPDNSARALLLTVLGEYVRPADRPVFTSALLDVLGSLGVPPAAARQALARTAAGGWITASRDGRRSRWSLTPAGHRLLTDGAARIYGFAPSASAWDGRWLVLLVSVPEARRPVRHALRTRLAWAGFGSPAPGVWLSAHASRESEAKQVLADLALDEAASFVGPYGGIGDPAALVARAWDLASVAAHYRAFLASAAAATPSTPAESLVAQTMLVHEWRRMPLIDPRLPADLLPPDWIGHEAAAAFRARHDEWSTPARRAWESIG
jgi:phenylacetic acid degradation operon negative regulatory protein